MPRPRETGPLATPFLVICDSRESQPYQFQGLVSDARDGRRPLLVRTEVRGLKSGDYSLGGFTEWVGVERKSHADLAHTIGQDRERFQRELQRLNDMQFAAVVVEAEWSEILAGPPPPSKLRPKTTYRSILAWQQRFPHCHWWFCPGRRMAEVTTFRILERYWRDHCGRPKDEPDAPTDLAGGGAPSAPAG